MTGMARLSLLRRLVRSDRGASLVEFAIVMPMLILLFGAVVEGGRMMWAYQTVAEGVRDATRYLGRIAPADVCTAGGLSAHTGDLETMVRNSSSGASLFPTNRRVTVGSVTAACVDGPGWPGVDPVVQVTASVTIDFPFGALLTIMGGDALGTVTATISDRTRVFGT